MPFLYRNSTYRNLLIIATVPIFLSCSVLSKQVTGTYQHQKFNDTLTLHADNTYEYHEKLRTGVMGWTNGRWQIKKNKIQFMCNTKPLVSYTLKSEEDSTAAQPSFKIFLDGTTIPVHIKEVKTFKDHKKVNDTIYHQNSNVAAENSNMFDSMVISTFYFKDIKLSNLLNTKQAYILSINPNEKLYELDKQIYTIRKNKLKGKINDHTYTAYYFKRIRVKKDPR